MTEQTLDELRTTINRILDEDFPVRRDGYDHLNLRQRWLEAPNANLNGEAPKDHMDTLPRARQVAGYLYRVRELKGQPGPGGLL